jgi:hypothetical protein
MELAYQLNEERDARAACGFMPQNYGLWSSRRHSHAGGLARRVAGVRWQYA